MSTSVWRPFLCRIARHSIYMNATPSSSESLKIDEQQLDLYIESIIEATASSLGDVVIRVSSSTKQSEKEFGNSGASSLNVCEILTSSYGEVTLSENLTAVCEPEGGTPVHVPSQEVFEPGGGTLIPAQKYEASPEIDALSQEVPVQESSDPPLINLPSPHHHLSPVERRSNPAGSNGHESLQQLGQQQRTLRKVL